MLSYEHIFFDLDGTLSDSAPGIINSVLFALSKLGIEEPNRARLTCFVGPPLLESFPKYYGLTGSKLTAAVNFFREYFREKGIFENSMYPGIPETLDRLGKAGRKLLVATSKPENSARDILERYGIADRFEFIGGSVLDESRTKKDEVIGYCMQTVGISDPSKILMVGDRSHDVLGAKTLSIDCMGVLYGYGDEAELISAGAKYIAATVSDVSRLILE
jgi:phosphoglycolate phosphatase